MMKKSKSKGKAKKLESEDKDIDPALSTKLLGTIIVTRKQKISQVEAPEASTSQLPPITIPPQKKLLTPPIHQPSVDNPPPPPSSVVPSNFLDEAPF